MTLNATVVGLIPTQGNELFKIYFFRFGNKTKRGVKFRHPTCNISKIQRKVGTEILNTKFPLPILLHAGYNVNQKNMIIKRTSVYNFLYIKKILNIIISFQILLIQHVLPMLHAL